MDADGESDLLALADEDLLAEAEPEELGLRDLDADALLLADAELDGLKDGEGDATAGNGDVQIAASLVPVFIYTFPPVLFNNQKTAPV